MKVTRLLFVAKYRIPSACISLQFDKYLLGIDQTLIITPCDVVWLREVFDRHNIDTSKFSFVSDDEFVPRYPAIENWVIPGDWRGHWLRQQAVKLACLDFLDHDVMMIQDPDTFAINPYRCWDGNQLNFFVIPNTEHSWGYYKVLENALGINRHAQTSDCFVTEFGPCLKQDITALRECLEQRNSTDWLTALIDNVPLEPSFSTERPNEMVKWFSEYELIGNWTMNRRSIKTTDQKRFQYKSLDQLHQLTNNNYNVAADDMKMEFSFKLDPDTQMVENYWYWVNLIRSRLQ